MSFIYVNENSFSYERLCTKTRFEKEVQDNSNKVVHSFIHSFIHSFSEMAYLLPLTALFLKDQSDCEIHGGKIGRRHKAL